jgi:hypothetical protein
MIRLASGCFAWLLMNMPSWTAHVSVIAGAAKQTPSRQVGPRPQWIASASLINDKQLRGILIYVPASKGRLDAQGDRMAIHHRSEAKPNGPFDHRNMIAFRGTRTKDLIPTATRAREGGILYRARAIDRRSRRAMHYGVSDAYPTARPATTIRRYNHRKWCQRKRSSLRVSPPRLSTRDSRLATCGS